MDELDKVQAALEPFAAAPYKAGAFNRAVLSDDDFRRAREALAALAEYRRRQTEAEAEIERLKNLLGDPEGTIAHADAILAQAAKLSADERQRVFERTRERCAWVATTAYGPTEMSRGSTCLMIANAIRALQPEEERG